MSLLLGFLSCLFLLAIWGILLMMLVALGRSILREDGWPVLIYLIVSVTLVGHYYLNSSHAIWKCLGLCVLLALPLSIYKAIREIRGREQGR